MCALVVVDNLLVRLLFRFCLAIKEFLEPVLLLWLLSNYFVDLHRLCTRFLVLNFILSLFLALTAALAFALFFAHLGLHYLFDISVSHIVEEAYNVFKFSDIKPFHIFQLVFA